MGCMGGFGGRMVGNCSGRDGRSWVSAQADDT